MNFFTFFSYSYIPKATILIRSIKKFHPNSKIFVVLLDDESRVILNEFPELVCFDWKTIVFEDSQLSAAIKFRDFSSQIFSSVPVMTQEVLKLIGEDELLIYLDADTALFSELSQLKSGMQDYSLGLFAHDFNFILRRYLLRFGKFNAGAFIVRADEFGRAFLKSWRGSCINWCLDEVGSNGEYSNQKYLENYGNSLKTINLQPMGGDIAPWNSSWRDFSFSKSLICYRNNPLLFFHFHGIEKIGSRWFLGHLNYGMLLRKKCKEFIYQNYLTQLEIENSHYGVSAEKSHRYKKTFASKLLGGMLIMLKFILRQTFVSQKLAHRE